MKTLHFSSHCAFGSLIFKAQARFPGAGGCSHGCWFSLVPCLTLRGKDHTQLELQLPLDVNHAGTAPGLPHPPAEHPHGQAVFVQRNAQRYQANNRRRFQRARSGGSHMLNICRRSFNVCNGGMLFICLDKSDEYNDRYITQPYQAGPNPP